ncbi:MAG TPA: NUDIX domain-containing protein [Stellaceae bacterium]|nr:NUDIX domain-containing protein [Stellaceae bacterium]
MSGNPFLDDTARLAPSDAVAAILLAPDGRYVLQLRDDIPGIFYPGHWGCFGGALEASDASVEAGLRRELAEETGIALAPDAATYFTETTFDMGFAGIGVMRRVFFEARASAAEVAGLRLGEGSRFALFTAREALSLPRIVPYDAFALWLHANRSRIVPRSKG